MPDITVYVEALDRRILGEPSAKVRIREAFLLRSFAPPVEALVGKRVREVKRVGTRIAIVLDDELWVVIHLMIAGRLHWKPPGAKLTTKSSLAASDFPKGTLLISEAGAKHKASLFVQRGAEAWREHDPGGLKVESATLEDFTSVLIRANHTIKRALTDPHGFSGIGNAYSDEILHLAKMSPLLLTQKLMPEQVARLFEATRETFRTWVESLRSQTGKGWPEGVTAFRREMAVHGRFGLPCPVRDAPVQRIRYADRETNYCARCQTVGGFWPIDRCRVY